MLLIGGSMFVSDFSGKVFGPKVSAIKIVVEKRLKTYHNVVKKKTKITEGWEIVKELNVAPSEIELVNRKYNLGKNS